jgi:tRNA G10  N-methylase Trm11
MKYQYAFILGRVYTLSLAELLEVLLRLEINNKVVSCAPEVVVLEFDQKLPIEKLQTMLGGVIKIIRLFDTFQKKGNESPAQVLTNYFTFNKINSEYFTEYTGKKQFGVSIYSLDPAKRYTHDTSKIAFQIKKILQEQGLSVRAVLPQFPAQTLSSVLVNENQLLNKGAEIVVITGTQRLFVGKTRSVQNYEDYGRRDYQRPARDEKGGMLPPKVAQSMLNLAGPLKQLDYVLDPFCGSGTVLQEAMLFDYRAIGSDIDEHAVHNSEKNLEWFRNRYHVAPERYKLFLSNAAEISLKLPSYKIQAIITEGTLGPIYGKSPKQSEMNRNFKELSKLYSQVFKEFKKFLSPSLRVVIALPAYKQGRDNYVFMPNLDFIEKNAYTVRDPINTDLTTKYKFLKVTDRKSIVYDRKDQIVAREIMVIENQKLNT